MLIADDTDIKRIFGALVWHVWIHSAVWHIRSKAAPVEMRPMSARGARVPEATGAARDQPGPAHSSSPALPSQPRTRVVVVAITHPRGCWSICIQCPPQREAAKKAWRQMLCLPPKKNDCLDSASACVFAALWMERMMDALLSRTKARGGRSCCFCCCCVVV